MVWDDFVRPVQLVQLLKQIQFVSSLAKYAMANFNVCIFRNDI